ncbi:enoyl-CoA hydratase/isomerase family protein [Streptomyces iconiensis]|uniref:Enoyl-CoA hydratase/isomerase family protein n=1 Tax=Streptomyces iconiensis TaxID=1384038 RepID=A0ABT7A6J9_9ACTN|nr:enoyl-CoA hydratase/isomerase family protein [Streptomyces iconiensis]MDJ1136945.1 enoyl-CoA hydratase/isomerase family protein [Streptomyces iconiensis]
MPLTETGYTALRVTRTGAVATVTLDNPPVNTIDKALVTDLIQVVRSAKDDHELRVLVVESANPEFFSAHADLTWMFEPEELVALADDEGDPNLNPLQQLHERFRALPQITIAKLRGRLRAGGAELAMAADMRFAARGETWLAQPETRMGIFPGGGGTQYLTRLVGRARALEVVLGAELFDTDLAERYGWINRAVAPDALDTFVDALARRIGALPTGVAEAAKQAIDAAEASGPVPDLTEEAQAHAKVYPAPRPVVDRMARAVEAGAQTRDGELALEELLDGLDK